MQPKINKILKNLKVFSDFLEIFENKEINENLRHVLRVRNNAQELSNA